MHMIINGLGSEIYGNNFIFMYSIYIYNSYSMILFIAMI